MGIHLGARRGASETAYWHRLDTRESTITVLGNGVSGSLSPVVGSLPLEHLVDAAKRASLPVWTINLDMLDSLAATRSDRTGRFRSRSWPVSSSGSTATTWP